MAHRSPSRDRAAQCALSVWQSAPTVISCVDEETVVLASPLSDSSTIHIMSPVLKLSLDTEFELTLDVRPLPNFGFCPKNTRTVLEHWLRTVTETWLDAGAAVVVVVEVVVLLAPLLEDAVDDGSSPCALAPCAVGSA